MEEKNEVKNEKSNAKKITTICVIVLIIVLLLGGIILYISKKPTNNIYNNSNQKSNDEIGKEIYNELLSIHNNTTLISSTAYNGWVYSKGKKISNTLYQQLDREYNIPFEFTLSYYKLTDEYNSQDTYGRIKILDDIDIKLEEDMVFVILKYYEDKINETTLLLNQVKDNLKQMDNSYKYYDILTELYSGELKLNDFNKNPKGTLIELKSMISETTKNFDTNITKLEIAYGD